MSNACNATLATQRWQRNAGNATLATKNKFEKCKFL
jgi:hypothetical protein